MVNVRHIVSSLVCLAIIPVARSHPGETHSEEDIKREVARQEYAQTKARRSLSECANSPDAVALRTRAAERRVNTARALRQVRGLTNSGMKSKRDQASLERWSQESHDESDLGYTLDTPADTIFGSNATCVLVPESGIGPYWVAGELIRTDITDGEQGVPLHLDIQFVDIGSCGPVESMAVDLWHSNAMGLYSGVPTRGQGGLETTFNRGVQLTDAEGVVTFDTIFPGHYNGRATHIHLMSREGAEVLDNNTYTGGVANHIGQLYFDQSLISTVEETEPYTANQQRLTENQNDWLAASGASPDYDPFMDYVFLGDEVSNGLLAWIVVGVDPAADYNDDVSAAAYWGGSGGGSEGSDQGGAAGSPASPTASSGASRLRILF